MRSVSAAMSGTAPPSTRRASVKGRISKQQQKRRCVPCPRASRRKRRALFAAPRSGAIRGTIGRHLVGGRARRARLPPSLSRFARTVARITPRLSRAASQCSREPARLDVFLASPTGRRRIIASSAALPRTVLLNRPTDQPINQTNNRPIKMLPGSCKDRPRQGTPSKPSQGMPKN